MAKHIETGRTGEDIALRLLEDKGYIIHELNWRQGSLELDIIAQEGTDIVFVEVKTRRNNSYGSALEAISIQKQRNMIRAAEQYIHTRGLNYYARFDIITIDYSPTGEAQVEHIRNAFYPTARLQQSSKNQAKSYRRRIPKTI